MPIAIILLLVDMTLIVHAAKTGRFQPWGYLILALPGFGALAYVLFELTPEWLGTYEGRAARRRVARVVNPGRRYRALVDELALVDTIANRAALAEECLALGKCDEALFHYTAILGQPLGDDPQFLLGRARAEFGLARPDATVASLDELLRRWPEFHSPDGHLLYAVALQASGRNDEALANYADVGRYYPGAEPRVRQAQLLQSLGREAEARALAQDIVVGFRRAPAHVRRSQRQWLASAQRLARG